MSSNHIIFILINKIKQTIFTWKEKLRNNINYISRPIKILGWDDFLTWISQTFDFQHLPISTIT